MQDVLSHLCQLFPVIYKELSKQFLLITKIFLLGIETYLKAALEKSSFA